MAKKKIKTFKKSQLLSLFHNENYQKVISKIKQFEIEGMSAEELHKIKLTSYEKLANANFKLGDISRAMRDIESLLAIENSDEYRLIKLKYLCYMEHFEDAVVFGKDLIDSKNLKIKKEAMFLYLLADVYNDNYLESETSVPNKTRLKPSFPSFTRTLIDEKNLKLLPIARQNYILGFNAFSQGEVETALIFFDKCNPRAKVEKENVKAIKYIILNQDGLSSETLKPLYRFLINGDDTNLQNTKNSRTIKKEILSQFAKNKKKSDIENLISLKSSISIETIGREIKDKEQQTKLIYNNIILLIEKQKNLSKALELFIKHRNSLIQFVESGMLFIQIKSLVEDRKSDKLIINFFSSYLRLHHKKLSEFQLDFIFIFLLKAPPIESAVKLIEEYGGKDILFLFRDMSTIDKIEPSHQERFNKIMRKHSVLKAKALDGLSGYINVLDENIDEMSKKEKELLGKQLSLILILFGDCQKAHKKYQPTIFEILSSMAKFIQNFEFSKNRELYIQLSETIHSFMEIYKMDRVDLSSDIKTLFTSIEKKKSIKKEKKTEDEHFLSLFKDMMNDYENDEDMFDFDDDDDDDYMYDEEDLLEVKEEFIEKLANNEDPFYSELIDLADSCYADVILEFILDLLSKAIEFKRYDDAFTSKLFNVMNISMEDKEYREQLIVSIKEYAKKDIKTATLLLYDVIALTPTKDRETLWYLKWLETYLYLIDDYAIPKSEVFKGILGHLLRVQQKKRFKSFNSRFEKLIDRFKDKGLF